MMNIAKVKTPFQVLLYYLYASIDDPGSFAAAQRMLCESLDLRGRILIGHEGINGTVSGTVEATSAYMRAMHEDPRTAAMEFKVDAAEGHVFPKLSVKEREEVVRLGLPPEEDIDPAVTTGRRLSPREFYEAMASGEAVLLDGRNNYETALGRFRGAICPDVEHFRDFPAWIRENLGHLKDRKVLTYCTGGIRCEKLSGFLLREGFLEVCQLDGGIVGFSKDEATRGRDFDGLCYVFDERVGVEVNRTETRKIVSLCRHCGQPSARYRNCAWPECNRQFFCCEGCEEPTRRTCSEECRQSIRDQGVA